VTPTPYPDYGSHISTVPLTAVDRVLLGAMFTLGFVWYWSPTILGIWRRNSRMGLVIFYNLLGFMLIPWFSAWVVVLGEHSHHTRKYVPPTVWTPEQAAAWAPSPEGVKTPVELPANVTPLRPSGESEAAKARRLMREWGRH
jgi:hypothetical protein